MVATTDEHDERTLIEAAQADPARFVELYERYFHRIYGFVIRRTGSRTEAEDITSDVFERALTNLGRYEWRGLPFSAWLFRIAANAMADRRRQIGRHDIGVERRMRREERQTGHHDDQRQQHDADGELAIVPEQVAQDPEHG